MHVFDKIKKEIMEDPLGLGYKNEDGTWKDFGTPHVHGGPRSKNALKAHLGLVDAAGRKINHKGMTFDGNEPEGLRKPDPADVDSLQVAYNAENADGSIIVNLMKSAPLVQDGEEVVKDLVGEPVRNPDGSLKMKPKMVNRPMLLGFPGIDAGDIIAAQRLKS